MSGSVRKRRILIIAAWIVCLIAATSLFFHIEKQVYYERAETDLLGETEIIAKQIPKLAEDSFNTRVSAKRLLFSKLRALALALEDYDSIEEAGEFLESFTQAADIEGLAIYDRSGTLLYGSDAYSSIDFNADLVNRALDSHMFEKTAQDIRYSDLYRDYLFSSKNLNETDESYSWGVKDQWLLTIKDTESEAQKNTEDYFEWSNVLQRIIIGRSGYVLALDEADGTVLSCADSGKNGAPVEELEIRMNGGDAPASLDDLLAAFGSTDTVEKLEIAGKVHFAARLDVDRALMLALLPVEEIDSELDNAAGLLLFLLFLATGMFVLFAVIHVSEMEMTERKGRFAWDRHLSLRLKTVVLIASICVFALGVYLESLSVFANTFSYSQTKANHVVERLNQNDEAVKELQTWFDGEYD